MLCNRVMHSNTLYYQHSTTASFLLTSAVTGTTCGRMNMMQANRAQQKATAAMGLLHIPRWKGPRVN